MKLLFLKKKKKKKKLKWHILNDCAICITTRKERKTASWPWVVVQCAVLVQVLDDEEERMIKLTAPEMRMVLAEQMTGLLRESPSLSLPLDQVLLAFQRQYGFPLRLSDFGVHDVKSLLGKIKHCVSVSWGLF